VFIYSNLATSIDGKIATASREQFPLGTPEDLKLMIALRRDADAVLMGASTLRAYRKPLRVKGKDPQPVNVIVSLGLEGITPDWPFFQASDVRRILFVSKTLETAVLKEFEKSSEVVPLKPGTPIARQIADQLASRGIKRLVVEGGGGVMWDFVAENLIDEYYVTITPRILGGTEAPTLVDGPGFTPDQVMNLKLKDCRVVGDEVYLVYSKTSSRGRELAK
jgi:riboflavin-specific deaminase-like protein